MKEKLLKELLDQLHANDIVSEAADWGREIYAYYVGQVGYIPRGTLAQVVAALSVAHSEYDWVQEKLAQLR